MGLLLTGLVGIMASLLSSVTASYLLTMGYEDKLSLDLATFIPEKPNKAPYKIELVPEEKDRELYTLRPPFEEDFTYRNSSNNCTLMRQLADNLNAYLGWCWERVDPLAPSPEIWDGFFAQFKMNIATGFLERTVKSMNYPQISSCEDMGMDVAANLIFVLCKTHSNDSRPGNIHLGLELWALAYHNLEYLAKNIAVEEITEDTREWRLSLNSNSSAENKIYVYALQSLEVYTFGFGSMKEFHRLFYLGTWNSSNVTPAYAGMKVLRLYSANQTTVLVAQVNDTTRFLRAAIQDIFISTLDIDPVKDDVILLRNNTILPLAANIWPGKVKGSMTFGVIIADRTTVYNIAVWEYEGTLICFSNPFNLGIKLKFKQVSIIIMNDYQYVAVSGLDVNDRPAAAFIDMKNSAIFTFVSPSASKPSIGFSIFFLDPYFLSQFHWIVYDYRTSQESYMTVHHLELEVEPKKLAHVSPEDLLSQNPSYNTNLAVRVTDELNQEIETFYLDFEILWNMTVSANITSSLTHMAYLGQKRSIPIQESIFEVNAPEFGFLSMIGDYSISVEFKTPIQARFPYPKSKQYTIEFHNMGENFFALEYSDHAEVMGCSSTGGQVRCIQVLNVTYPRFNHSSPESHSYYLLAIRYQNGIIVMAGVDLSEGMEKGITIVEYFNLNNSAHFKQHYPHLTSLQASINSFQGKVTVFLLAQPTGVMDLYAYSIYTLEFTPEIRPNLLPIRPMLFLEVPLGAELYKFSVPDTPIKTIHIIMRRTGQPTAMLTYSEPDDFDFLLVDDDKQQVELTAAVELSTTEEDSAILLYVCSTSKVPAIIDRVRNEIYTVTTDTYGNKRTIKFPFADYNFKRILCYSCIQNSRILQVVAEKVTTGVDGRETKQPFLINYRLSDVDNPLGRIHSIIALNKTIMPRAIASGPDFERDSVYTLILPEVMEGSSVQVQAFLINLDSPMIEADLTHVKNSSDLEVPVFMNPHDAEGELLQSYEVFIKVLDQNTELTYTKPLKPQEMKEGMIDLEALISPTGIIFDARLEGITGEEAKNNVILHHRLEKLPGHPDFKRVGENPLGTRILGQGITVSWNSTSISIYEPQYENPRVYEYSKPFTHVHVPRFTPFPIVVGLTEGAYERVTLTLLYQRSSTGKWSRVTGKFPLVFHSFRVMVFPSEVDSVFKMVIVGFTFGSSVVTQVSLSVNTAAEVTPYTDNRIKVLSLTPLRDLEDSISMMDAVYKHQKLIIILFTHSSNNLHMISIDFYRDGSIKPPGHSKQVTIPEIGEDFRQSRLCCWPMPNATATEWYDSISCVLATPTYQSYMFTLDFKYQTSEIIKPFTNLKGFLPIRLSLSDKFTAILVRNQRSLVEESSSSDKVLPKSLFSGSSLQDQDKRSTHRRVLESDYYTSGTGMTDEYLIVVYSNSNDSSSTPFSVLSQTTLQKLQPDSKLHSILFDLGQSTDNQTILAVNSRFESDSIIRRYVLQPLSLEIKDPSKVHLKRTKISLVGVDSERVIALDELFRSNYLRMGIIWLALLCAACSLYAVGAYLIFRHHNRKYDRETMQRSFMTTDRDTRSLGGEREDSTANILPREVIKRAIKNERSGEQAILVDI